MGLRLIRADALHYRPSASKLVDRLVYYSGVITEMLEKVVEQKIRKGGQAAPEPKPRRKPSNVIALLSVLQQSIEDAKHKSKPRKKAA